MVITMATTTLGCACFLWLTRLNAFPGANTLKEEGSQINQQNAGEKRWQFLLFHVSDENGDAKESLQCQVLTQSFRRQ